MTTPSIDTVVFDLGGVLIDWNPEYVFEEIFPDPEQRKWFFDNICTHEWNTMQDAGRSLDEATRELVEEYPAYTREIKAYYGRWEEMLGGQIHASVRILEALREKGEVRLLALTNWSSETFPVAHERYDFLKWFEGIVVSGIERTVKPRPEIYRILLSRYAVDASRAVFIDDSSDNVQGAREVGMHAIHFRSADQLSEKLNAMGVRT